MASGNSKNFELKLGKTGLIILTVGMAALLCCTFLWGIDVGKNIDTYPGQIASVPQKLLALVWRPAKAKAVQSAYESKAEPGQSKNQEELDLTFYNTLTGKKGTVSEKPIPDKKPVTETPEIKQIVPSSGNEAGLVPAASNPEARKQQIAADHTAGDVIQAKIKKAEEEAVVQAGKFSVQVASLREKIKANQMSKKVSALGYKPRVVENNIPGKGKWFRIVIDGFASKTQAQAAADKISDKSGTNCVIRRIDASAANGN
jgi:cell division septation protein DedD